MNKRELENMKDRILSALHDVAGLCGHCGKRDCAGRNSNSYLPGVIDTDKVIESINRATGNP